MDMKNIEIRYLEGWPPTEGGAHARGSFFPQSGEGPVDKIERLNGKEVIFSGEFSGHRVTYHFFAADEKIAERVHAVISSSLGKTVAELSALEIEVETKAVSR
jgi:hypothetical protein